MNPPTTEHRVGKVIGLDLETTDLASAKKFYSGLFGWDFRDYHTAGTDYAVAMQRGRPETTPLVDATSAGGGMRPLLSNRLWSIITETMTRCFGS